MPDLVDTIKRELALALVDDEAEASYKALRLNQGLSDVSERMLIAAETWLAMEAEAEKRGSVIWGVDLGGTAAQSAVAGYWPETGRLEAVAAFSVHPDLGERQRKDKVGELYRRCFDRGELIQCGGHAVDVGELPAHAYMRFGAPVAVAADRFRDGELIDGLKAADVPPARLEWRGMGFIDGGEDVRCFRRACLEGKVRPVRSLILRASMAAARVQVDPAANEKITKARC